ncbi:hypothetical protein ACFQJC_02190 [Haloferax namakaokahaiae]|uniref:Uncharacterized protein n=1 Tax=Haloferax namakaokahaiae TaxID=1748331 RepID=A0ABD5ZAR6_9EURY
MHRWSQLVLRWKLLLGVVLPVCFLAVALAVETPIRGIGAAVFVALALGVVYVFIRFVNENA